MLQIVDSQNGFKGEVLRLIVPVLIIWYVYLCQYTGLANDEFIYNFKTYYDTLRHTAVRISDFHDLKFELKTAKIAAAAFTILSVDYSNMHGQTIIKPT